MSHQDSLEELKREAIRLNHRVVSVADLQALAYGVKLLLQKLDMEEAHDIVSHIHGSDAFNHYREVRKRVLDILGDKE